MRNAMWVGGGITGMGEIPILGVKEKGIAKVIRDIFRNGEQGFFYDPSDMGAEKVKWRRNLLTETEFRNGINDSSIRAGALSPVAFAGLTVGTGIQVNTSTGGTYIYKSASYKANTPYTFSCYVRMLDGTAPRFGVSSSGSEIDICLVFKGAAYYAEVQDLGGGLYRAYATINSTNTGSYFGVVKYPGNSTKPVNVSGFQLEEGSQLTDYQAFTDFNTEFLRRFPLHTMYQDVVGVVPVATAGQPVGLMYDKSKEPALLPQSFQPALSIGGNGVAEIRPDNTFYIMRGVGADAGAINIPTSPNKWYKLVIEILSGNPISIRLGAGTHIRELGRSQGKFTLYVNMASFEYLRFVNMTDNQEAVFKIHSLDELQGNPAYQTTSAARPILQNNPSHLAYDGVDDKLITNLPAPLTNATVLRAIPGVGTQVRYNQTLPMLYEDSTNHAGLIAIDRALTRSEQLRLMTELDKKAGTTSLETLTFQVFDNNQEGFVYDPNDLSTLYQDAAGTVPVTEVGQPVGLILDKKNPAMIGGEVDVDVNNWSAPGGVTIVDKNTFSSQIAATGLFYNGAAIDGLKIVELHYTVTGGIVQICDAVAARPRAESSQPSGVLKATFYPNRASNPLGRIYFRLPTEGTTLVIDKLIIHTYTGNHAYQTTSASRPILRKNDTTGANYLEFDGTDDFMEISDLNGMPESTVVTGNSLRSSSGNHPILSKTVGGYLYLSNTRRAYVQVSGNNFYTDNEQEGDVQSVVYEKSLPTGHQPTKLKTNLGENVGTITGGLRSSGLGYLGRASTTGMAHAAINLYGITVVGKVLQNAEIESLREYYNKQLGVTINV